MRATIKDYLITENNKYPGKRCLPKPINSKRTTPRRNRTRIDYTNTSSSKSSGKKR